MIQFNFESERMTSAQVVETSVTVNNNSPVQGYVHPDDHTQPTYNLFGRFGGLRGMRVIVPQRVTERCGRLRSRTFILRDV